MHNISAVRARSAKDDPLRPRERSTPEPQRSAHKAGLPLPTTATPGVWQSLLKPGFAFFAIFCFIPALTFRLLLHTVYSMQNIIPLPPRYNISEDIAAQLREMVVDGALLPGERINEVHLAARLRISRTPLREALTRLVAEGAMVQIPRRGFFVRDLTREEFENVYPIRAILDPKALELSGIPPASRLRRLAELNKGMLSADKAERIIQLDDAWHLELLADCPNPILIDLIRQFMRRTRCYELALMREQRNVKNTVESHKRIMRALRAGNLPGACDALANNMKTGMKPILDWLAEREKKMPRYHNDPP